MWSVIQGPCGMATQLLKTDHNELDAFTSITKHKLDGFKSQFVQPVRPGAMSPDF